MKPIGDANFNGSASAANALWRMRALQKPSASSDLRGERQDPQQASPQHGRKSSADPLPQNGTREPVSFRHDGEENAPRLTSAFVAQLLGQIMPDPERRASAAPGYGRETRSLSLGLDTKL